MLMISKGFNSGIAACCQFLPPSRVTCTRPSSVPIQIRPALSGEGPIAEIAAQSRLVLPSGRGRIGRSGRTVRSGLMRRQLSPPSEVSRRNCAPSYKMLPFLGENTNGGCTEPHHGPIK